jgi:hypothetical protein
MSTMVVVSALKRLKRPEATKVQVRRWQVDDGSCLLVVILHENSIVDWNLKIEKIMVFTIQKRRNVAANE